MICSTLVLLISICSLRLVMPPALFFTLQLPFTQLGYVLFPVAITNGIIAGSFTFCENMDSFRRGGSKLTE